MKKFLILCSTLLASMLLVVFPTAKQNNPKNEICQNLSVAAVSVEEDSNLQTDTEKSQSENEKEKFDWSVWFKEKCMPVIIGVGGAVVTLCSLLYPVLNTVNGGVKLFKGSKDNFEKVTKEVVESQQKITEFKDTALSRIDNIKNEMEQGISDIDKANREELAKIKDDISQTFNTFKVKLEDLIKQTQNQVRVMKIAFGNDKELVKNGYANQIMKIGAEDEVKTVENENNSDANN